MELSILGGGIAGLATGWFARNQGLTFSIYEASRRVGGLCQTFSVDGFAFDSGAHRLHGQDREMTELLASLLGPRIKRVTASSQIYHRGAFFDFPLAPFNLVRKLGVKAATRIVFEVTEKRLRAKPKAADFESTVVHRYGRSLAERFLLGYTEKLWGVPCNQLSDEISSARLKGLSLRTFLLEVLRPGRNSGHLEGSFFYPEGGIGTLAEALADGCGRATIHTDLPIRQLEHDGKSITRIHFPDHRHMVPDVVVSSLPLGTVLRLLQPQPPAGILNLAKELRFRDLILVAVFVDRPSITPFATIYFPDREIPFTRAFEPRNRCAAMSPEGQTSIVVEIPCTRGDGTASENDDSLAKRVTDILSDIGWVRAEELLGFHVVRIPNAYPVMTRETPGHLQTLATYLEGFENLYTLGRNGSFSYISLHHVLRMAQETVNAIRCGTASEDVG